MAWLLVLVVWTLLSAPVALLVGRLIRRSDERGRVPDRSAVPDLVPPDWATSSTPAR